MGNQQPKKPQKIPKAQIEVACMKSKYHLQLMRDRKNAEIIRTEKQLVNKIKSKNRNRTQEILLAERVVNALKYAQACNFLMSYAASLKPQANYLSENFNNPQKLAPYLEMIYSLIYAAEHLGLSSLKEFQAVMRGLNDPNALPQYVNQQIMSMMAPQPTAMEMNTYFIEMSERNDISLEEINVIGHKYSRNYDGPESNNNNMNPNNSGNNTSNSQSTFSDMERKLAEELKKNFNGGGQQQSNQGGYVPGGYNPQQGGGFNPQQGGYNPQQSGGYNPQQGGSYNPNFNPQQGGGFNPNNSSPYEQPTNNPVPVPSPSFNLDDSNPYGYRESYKDGNINNAGQQKPKAPYDMDSRVSIKGIDDIDFYPEIQPGSYMGPADPDFNTLCQMIKQGL